MRYNELGEIVVNGSTDAEDGPVAGACAMLFTGQEVKVANYLKIENSISKKPVGYRRCIDSKYTFSRDQTVALFAILYLKGLPELVDTKYIDGEDVMWGIGSHIRICQGKKPFFYQTWIFKLSLWFSAKFKPLEELNQLFFQLMVHPDKSLLKWYCDTNPRWAEAIANYFDSWRQERDLANTMIKVINERINA
jgi:hypothetical protein